MKKLLVGLLATFGIANASLVYDNTADVVSAVDESSQLVLQHSIDFQNDNSNVVAYHSSHYSHSSHSSHSSHTSSRFPY